MTPTEKERATIPALFAATVRRRPSQSALGVIKDGHLVWQTWAELAEKVAAAAAQLTAHGVNPGDCVAQLSPNCDGWIIADLAIQTLGAVHVPLHTSLGPDQIAQQLTHCDAKLVVIPNESEIRVPKEFPAVTHETLTTKQSSSSHLPSPVSPNDLATILYTSGTTGPPRGVMLSHRNIASNAIAMADALARSKEETQLLILPLSHIYARTCDLYVWLYRGTQLAIAESRETVLRDLQLVKPTGINAVPYFYEKAADFFRSDPGLCNAESIRAYFGGAVTTLYCGGAPLAPDVERFFADRGFPVLCGYGLSEASPVICASTAENHSLGSVGPPLPNLEVRLAPDGEIQVRGPSVMLGYWKNPADTAAAFDNGWLRTGDLGQWEPGGNLRIVGRKKEMLVLATGKKVVPTRIEQLLAASPLIDQSCVLGDGRKCLAALIVPTAELLTESRLDDPALREKFRAEIDRCLGGVADFEQIGPFSLLPSPFTIEQGELTPKLSLCRTAIVHHYAAKIEAMYQTLPPAKKGAIANI
jgi:long-chain acyl-CoA synthetase